MIHIVNDYYLDSDENCFLLHKWNGKCRTMKNGSTCMDNPKTTYYSKLSDLIASLANKLMRENARKCTSLEELKAALDELMVFLREFQTRLAPDYITASAGNGTTTSLTAKAI